MRRKPPRQLIVQTGLHPNPGPPEVTLRIRNGGFDDSQGWTQEEVDTSGEDFGVRVDDGGGVWACLFPDEQQHEPSSRYSCGELQSDTAANADYPDIWEQMKTEWINDGEKKYLDSIGCPWVGHSIQPLLRQRKRKDGLAGTFDIANTTHLRAHDPPNESSDDELIEADDDSDRERIPALAYSDDELEEEETAERIQYDFELSTTGWSRGEREEVLGTEHGEVGLLRWSLATEPPAVECPSVKKQRQEGAKQNSPLKGAPAVDATPPVQLGVDSGAKAGAGWKPMSATKIREAAKSRASLQKVKELQGTEEQTKGVRKQLWDETFDNLEKWHLGEAAYQYASWISAGRPGAELKEEVYIPSEGFDGSRDGWVYKTSTLGTGYHKEGIRSGELIQLHRLLWPLAEVEPMPIELDKLIEEKKCIGDPLQATTEDDPVKVVRPKRRKDKKMKSRAAVASREGRSSTDKKTVQFSDKSHREAGWWAIDSVNANAWDGALEAMATTSADLIGVQEAKVEAHCINDCENTARNKGWRTAMVGCNLGEGGGRSAGVAVACRNHVGLSESFEDDKLPNELKGRFVVKHAGMICKGGIHIVSVYFHTVIGLHHQKNLDMMQAIGAVLATLKGPWVICADWQGTPEDLEQTGWMKMIGGVIVAPEMATCHKRTIDFFVISEGLASSSRGAVTVGDALCKPHKPARLYLEAGARRTVIRTLGSMGTFGAKLPFGPLNKVEYDISEEQGLANSQRYNLFTCRMEDELTSLMAIDEVEANKFRGRSQGPRFVQRNALEENAAGARRTTAVSRCWRRMAGWMQDWKGASCPKEKAEAVRKLLHYKHAPPARAMATQQQKDSFGNFTAWQLSSQRACWGM